MRNFVESFWRNRVVVLFVTSGVLVGFVGVPLARDAMAYARPDVISERPLRTGETREIVVTVVGASHCGASMHSLTKSAVAQLRQRVDSLAKLRGDSVVLRVVALDQNLSNALRFVSRIGRPNELIVGRGWANDGIHDWYRTPDDTTLAIPAVVISSQVVRLGARDVSIDSRKFIARARGGREIATLARSLNEL
jgi:hypothetical protein